jgi:hypothetical protein
MNKHSYLIVSAGATAAAAGAGLLMKEGELFRGTGLFRDTTVV